MRDLAIRNGTILTPDGSETLDVAIDDGLIVEIGRVGDASVSIDANGAWVGPAFVDLHAHLREPGEEWKEDIGTGSMAAAEGGFGAIVAMPNTIPAVDTAHLARYVLDRGRDVGLVDVIPAGCLTMERAGRSMAHIDEMWDAGVRIFTDDGDTVADASLLRLIMEYLAERGGVVSQHAVDPAMSAAGHMHEGSVSSRLGMYGIPGQADDIVIARDLMLAELTGVRYHVQHLSTSRGVQLIEEARKRGVSVTAEVTPHHLLFTDVDAATTDPNFKMMPPLRSGADRTALRDGLRSGVIDVVATDHAPHTALEKEVPFEEAPNGVLGLEWAASVVMEAIEPDISTLFQRLSITPAVIAGLGDHGNTIRPGIPANVVVFDADGIQVPSTSRSRSRNAPYFGRSLRGVVRATILRGSVTHARPDVATTSGSSG